MLFRSDKDVKKSRYNVLFNVYGENCRSEAVKKGEKELVFIFDMLFAQLRESLSAIQFHFNHDLTDNIILRGIPLKTRTVFYSGCGSCGNGTVQPVQAQKSLKKPQE